MTFLRSFGFSEWILLFKWFYFIRNDHGHHDHEAYYGDRDTDSLVKVHYYMLYLLLGCNCFSALFIFKRANIKRCEVSSPQTMEDLVASLPSESRKLALEDKSNATGEHAKRPAPSSGGCRIEGYVRVKKVNC